MTVVKVQRPLVGSVAGDQPEILVYDERRAHLAHLHSRKLPRWLTKALAKMPKVFAEAEWDDAQGWQFVKIAEWQPW
jgi:hypothetical protein